MTIPQETYLLDTNILVEAHRRYYAFDFCPGFWQFIENAHREGRVFSIDRVEKEINMNNDVLADWVNNDLPKEFFLSTARQETAIKFGKLINWAQGTDFKPEAKAEFAAVADTWLIAQASTEGFTIVTHEILNPNIKRKIPIPNVCAEFGVKFVDTFTMLRDLKARFMWLAP